MNWLTQPLERVFLRPLRSLGGLSFDVVVSEEHEDTLTIAKHPVEQGANISDHAYRNPCKVVIRGASSESPYGLPVWDPYNATLYNALLALQNAREPFDIVTGKRKYGNMLLEKLTVTTTPDSEHALMVTAECREVIIVRTQVIAVPAEPGRHRNPAKTGGTANKGQKQAVPVR